MPRVPPAPTTYQMLTTQLRTTYTQFEFCHRKKQGTKGTPHFMILRKLKQPPRSSAVFGARKMRAAEKFSIFHMVVQEGTFETQNLRNE